MDALKSILSPLAGASAGGIQDTLVRGLVYCSPFTSILTPHVQKLVVIGGTMETARRASVSAWNGFVDCTWCPVFFLTHTDCLVTQHSTSLPISLRMISRMNG